MKKTKRLAVCPECGGKNVDPQSYMLECEYCLSKKED
ncbi:YhfH family protein [Virgibacillus sp. NKC19-16]|nr:YhfH family protein [Virgibacillus sp. NKC19-16]UJL45225.1 YhfH family protein [Virgibacillus sp. NKC19-16]